MTCQRVKSGLTALAVLATLQGHALAADWLDDTLRGTFTAGPTVRWDGVSVGAHIGITNMDTDFGSSSGQQVAYILRNSTLENERIHRPGPRCRITSPTAKATATSLATPISGTNSSLVLTALIIG